MKINNKKASPPFRGWPFMIATTSSGCGGILKSYFGGIGRHDTLKMYYFIV